MQTQTEVRTEHTTDNDRSIMRVVLKKVLVRKLILYMSITFISILGLIILNAFEIRFNLDETVRGICNLVFVLGGALTLRLSIWEMMSYSKDVTNFQVKSAKGEIRLVKGKTIMISNYEFEIHPLPHLELKPGDQVELRAGYKSSSVFWLQKI